MTVDMQTQDILDFRVDSDRNTTTRPPTCRTNRRHRHDEQPDTNIDSTKIPE
jgi:hypothetical protein